MITSIAFLLRIKAKEHKPHHTWIKVAYLIFVKMNICHKTKNPGFEMKNGREQNMISEHDKGGSKRENTRWHSSHDINSISDCISSICLRCTTTNKKGTSNLKDVPVLSFSNAILLWSMRARSFMENTHFCKKKRREGS